MSVNVEVEKKPNENTGTVLRRFTKRVQNSGILKRARSLRYHERQKSKTLRRRQVLKLLEKRAYYEKMAKLGKPVGELKHR